MTTNKSVAEDEIKKPLNIKNKPFKESYNDRKKIKPSSDDKRIVDLNGKKFEDEDMTNIEIKQDCKVSRQMKFEAFYTKDVEIENNCLKRFETNNRFEVLLENPEENVQNVIKRNLLKQIPKKNLQKCKSCFFKRRSCIVDSFACKAYNRRCFTCNKLGHNPKSKKCTLQSKTTKTGKSSHQPTPQAPTKFSLSKTILKQIRNKIEHIEYMSEVEKTWNKESNKIPSKGHSEADGGETICP